MAGDDDLRVGPDLVIPAAELQWRFVTSGGPGGQHANRSATRVEVTFSVEDSAVLSRRQRERLRAALGSRVTVNAGDTRSQNRNRQVARDRLRSRLADALRDERPRRSTRPTRSSKRRRVDQKRRRGETKRLRGQVKPGDDG